MTNEKYEHENYKKATGVLAKTNISGNKNTLSTVIPAAIKNKFNISKDDVLTWDYKENCIIIRIEAATETTQD